MSAETENIKLTPRQRRFADRYLVSLNATRAAKEAGYSEKTAREIGYENLTKPHIRKYIDDRLNAEVAPASEVLSILSTQARGKLSDLLDENGEFDIQKIRESGADKLLKKLKITETVLVPGEVERKYEFEIHDPQGAADKLAKAHKLYTQTVELTGKGGKPLPVVTAVTIQPVMSSIPAPEPLEEDETS